MEPDWDAAQSVEEAMEQELEELIDRLPITKDERAMLRWHCGLPARQEQRV